MISEKIKTLRKEKRMTLEALADAVGTSKQTIHRYESGAISNIPRDKIEALARALDTSPAELVGWEQRSELPPYSNIMPITKRSLPMLGGISCGQPVLAKEEHECFVSLIDAHLADFCLRAEGDSMEGAGIYDGDIVMIRAQSSVDNGAVAAVIINDEATLKRVYYYPDDQKLVLSPENNKYAPLVYIGDQLKDIKILGQAIAYQSRVR
ncbi:MAG: helix-turn-helix domain-containing protein [Clostridia bacterium]|nr:helix-turn-helix domain-containing protein [Clostridia bacterium]